MKCLHCGKPIEGLPPYLREYNYRKGVFNQHIVSGMTKCTLPNGVILSTYATPELSTHEMSV